MNQCQSILHLLSDGRWHPVYEFVQALSIYRYSSRIDDIRKKGIIIDAVRSNDLVRTGVDYAKETRLNNLFYYRLSTPINMIDFDKIELKPTLKDENQTELGI